MGVIQLLKSFSFIRRRSKSNGGRNCHLPWSWRLIRAVNPWPSFGFFIRSIGLSSASSYPADMKPLLAAIVSLTWDRIRFINIFKSINILINQTNNYFRKWIFYSDIQYLFRFRYVFNKIISTGNV